MNPARRRTETIRVVDCRSFWAPLARAAALRLAGAGPVEVRLSAAAVVACRTVQPDGTESMPYSAMGTSRTISLGAFFRPQRCGVEPLEQEQRAASRAASMTPEHQNLPLRADDVLLQRETWLIPLVRQKYKGC